MAAKKKFDGGAARSSSRAKTQKIKQKSKDPNVSSASWGIPGKTYTPRGSRPSIESNPLRDKNTTPVSNSGSWTGLRGMQGPSNFQPKNWPKAASVVPATSAAKALSAFRVVRGVSNLAKEQQRALSATQKYFAGKDLKGMKKSEKAETLFRRHQSQLEDGYDAATEMKIIRQNVKESMKSNKGPLKIVKRKSARGFK